MIGTFRRHLHAQVAARHHHAVSYVQDLFQVLGLDGLRLLQLADDPCI
jgi:hypothetical protein